MQSLQTLGRKMYLFNPTSKIANIKPNKATMNNNNNNKNKNITSIKKFTSHLHKRINEDSMESR